MRARVFNPFFTPAEHVMANVVDPNSWRMAPLPDSHSSKLSRSGDPHFELAAGSTGPAVIRLAAALERAFDASHDRVTWLFQGPQGEQQLRIDPSHAASSSSTPLESDLETGAADPPWHVLVQTAEELASENGSPEVRAALEQDVRLLLVICGISGAGPTVAQQRQLAERVAARLRLRYLEPRPTGGEDELDGLLAEVKLRGSSSVLYFDAGGAFSATHCLPAKPAADLAIGERTYRDCALDALSALQRENPAVICLTPEETCADAAATLARCQTFAAEGRQPFMFLSLEAALDNLAAIRQVLSGDAASITLVLEAGSDERASAGSSRLAVLREFAGVSLLAPKDELELAQMLAWCARQNAPAIIWLAENRLPVVSWPPGEEIGAGRAEKLGAGADVALVAWGTTNAAAAIAAERLAELCIRATVVNVRFAQPLDIAGISGVCAASAYTVILDDCEAGGFGSWVCEQLIRRGLAPNMTIVSAKSGPPATAHEGAQALATAIVQRCRWLGDHLAELNAVLVARIDPPVTPCASPSAPPVDPWAVASVGTPDVQAQVLATQFSPFIAEWVERYGRVGSRDVYLWRWCLHGLDLTTLSCVAPALRRDLCDTKLLAVMYGVMLDDVADQAGGDAFLAALTGIIAGRADRDFSAFSSEQRRYAQFTCELWDTFRTRLQGSPCYAEYAELLDYDHQQILNTFAYSLMVNKRLALLNVQEHDMYQPHNMQMMSFATMDLMCSPDFDRSELGRLREVIWHAQSMGRIGNLVSTWQREIADRDFTSGVFARALREGDLSLEDLASAPPARIEAAVRRGAHEQYFLHKWEAHRQSIAALAAGIRSVDVASLLRALAQLLRMELDSRGFK